MLRALRRRLSWRGAWFGAAWSALGCVAWASACSKPEPAARTDRPDGPHAPVVDVPAAAASTAASRAAPAVASATPSGAASAAASAVSGAAAGGPAAAAPRRRSTSGAPDGGGAGSAAASASACGDKPLPPCPLYAWMSANAAPALDHGDFVALGAAFERLASEAPPAYANWASIARDGADAARVEHLEAVKAACRGCHDEYRARYKKEMRDRPI
ncbi:MAG TPA: hypothetical protein VE987_11915 [Polyangiaceae bacterium]|nr:hypothetical protein [Polyangiaceae bacterium]